ncbi:MAG: zinc ribbon domain-containing protein [Acidobacteriia bacterium]|nr:zinc ribbon domain-containing protein [Terriglobia bacterium]
MAFCTRCGARVSGAFCQACGQPLAATSAPAPARRRTSVLVWVLVVILGIAVAGGIATVAGGVFLVHKARQAGLDADLFRRNPGLAISKVIAAFNPDAEVVKTDESAGTVTLRDRRTGKEINITFDQARRGNFRFEAEDENGKRTLVQLGNDGVDLPSDLPVYPGAKVEATFEVDGNRESGEHGAYEYEFSTPDAPAKVMAFYERKLSGAGLHLALHNSTQKGGMLVAEDDDHHRTLRVIVSKESEGTTINVTARLNH